MVFETEIITELILTLKKKLNLASVLHMFFV